MWGAHNSHRLTRTHHARITRSHVHVFARMYNALNCYSTTHTYTHTHTLTRSHVDVKHKWELKWVLAVAALTSFFAQRRANKTSADKHPRHVSLPGPAQGSRLRPREPRGGGQPTRRGERGGRGGHCQRAKGDANFTAGWLDSCSNFLLGSKQSNQRSEFPPRNKTGPRRRRHNAPAGSAREAGG